MSDIEQALAVSDAAAAALQRGYDCDRERAGLLDYLIGELQYYAAQGATINYKVEPLYKGATTRRARRDVQDIVNKYKTQSAEIRARYAPPGSR